MAKTEVTGYRNDGVGTAVALVNLPDDAALAEVLAAFNFRVEELTADGALQLRTWAGRLRGVFTAADQSAATDVVNGLLADVPMGPHISDHGLGPHLHYAVPGAGLVDRVRANTAVGLAFLLCEYGHARLGVCTAEGCDRVYADVSRGPRRRFCGKACLNRTTVAAHRSRTRVSNAGNPRVQPSRPASSAQPLTAR